MPDRMNVVAVPAELAVRWRDLCERLGLAPKAERLLRELRDGYEAPARHYHTWQHITECLLAFDDARADLELRDPLAVEFAIFAHDIVYDASANDNERRSAEWARRAFLDGGLTAERAADVYALIIATTHAAAPTDGDAQALADIDLAILGASHERFAAYETAIRAEYSWVPEIIFRMRRREILEQFLARPSLYCTTWFRERLESAARSNLKASLTVLGGG